MSVAWIIVFLLSLIILFLFYQLLKLRSEVKKETQSDEKYRNLESKVESLELRSIRRTLNPHLFKNALNAIQSHAYQTYHTIDKLASVLDYILYESNQHYVSVKEEIDFALSLIEINRLKVSPLFDLRIKQNIDFEDPMYKNKKLAPLVTVDLIENAFKHAELLREGAFISIVFELQNNQFSLSVSNTVSSSSLLPKPKSGLGKENFKKRLEILYKENFTLEQFIKEDVYIAHLSINLNEPGAQMLTS